MGDKAALSKFVCYQNIARYERLLKTHLTDLERDFIERRITEEKHALRSAEALTLSKVVRTALEDATSAAKVIAIALLSNVSEFLVPSFDLVEQVGLI